MKKTDRRMHKSSLYKTQISRYTLSILTHRLSILATERDFQWKKKYPHPSASLFIFVYQPMHCKVQ